MTDKKRNIDSISEVYHKDGPFEEFGEDSSCSMSGEEGSQDSVESVIRLLFAYADDLLNKDKDCKTSSNDASSSRRNQAKKALEKCKAVILGSDEGLDRQLKRHCKRSCNDLKVPPGSHDIRRELVDKKYLLSIICFELAHMAFFADNFDSAKILLYEAIMWHPKSSQACYLLAKIIRAQALELSDLERVEKLLRKALSGSTLPVPSTDLISNRPVPAQPGNSIESDNDAFDGEEMDRQIQARLIIKERTAAFAAREALSLLLCQDGRTDVAYTLLKSAGFQWRLSREVLFYNFERSSLVTSGSPATKYIRVFDNVLASPMLTHMQYLFRPTSPFWSEHRYDFLLNAGRDVGYFSYLYPFRTRSAESYIEQFIDYIRPRIIEMFPEVSDCNIAEWWVHTRPHSAGHQLHFDSDETHIEDGGAPVHPVASCVVFLSDEVGGPTLVTNQTLGGGGGLATCGWLCPPRLNRLAVFDAKYLHGVIPGRGVPSAGSSADDGTAIPRRLTFMVGFWKDIRARFRGLDSPGPGQPMPDAGHTTYTWPKEMALKESGLDNVVVESGAVSESDSSRWLEVAPVPVSVVWEPIGAGMSVAGDVSKQTSSELLPTPRYDVCFQGF